MRCNESGATRSCKRGNEGAMGGNAAMEAMAAMEGNWGKVVQGGQ